MNGPLNNCEYDKIKILHELSTILWFVKKHALSDAKDDQECLAFLKQLEQHLEATITQLKKLICK